MRKYFGFLGVLIMTTIFLYLFSIVILNDDFKINYDANADGVLNDFGIFDDCINGNSVSYTSENNISAIVYNCNKNYYIRFIKIKKRINLDRVSVQKFDHGKEYGEKYLNIHDKYGKVNISANNVEVNDFVIGSSQNNLSVQSVGKYVKIIKNINNENKVGICLKKNKYGIVVSGSEISKESLVFVNKISKTYVIIIHSGQDIEHDDIINNLLKF